MENKNQKNEELIRIMSEFLSQFKKKDDNISN